MRCKSRWPCPPQSLAPLQCSRLKPQACCTSQRATPRPLAHRVCQQQLGRSRLLRQASMHLQAQQLALQAACFIPELGVTRAAIPSQIAWNVAYVLSLWVAPTGPWRHPNAATCTACRASSRSSLATACVQYVARSWKASPGCTCDSKTLSCDRLFSFSGVR